MEIFTTLLAFASEISIRHVLVLNLIGWMVKCFLQHRGWDNWTDVIPFILAIGGVTLAHFDLGAYQVNFIIHGLANAGMAWLLHKVVKETKKTVETYRGKQ